MKALLAAMVGLIALTSGCQHGPASTEAAERGAIEALLVEYGRTLDTRDFDGFAALFASDGIYIAGSGSEASGAEAGAMMRQVFEENALGFREPNYHLFFDLVIAFTGPNTARASSRSLYMVPDEDGAPRPAMMAEYEDELVREAGRWKFARRVVKGLLPAPAVPATRAGASTR